MALVRAVKGMNDILPSEIGAWRRFESTFRHLCSRYGFGELRTPVVEPTALFERSIGEATDIVQKEMYTFVDKGEKSLTLRPEGTASVVRAYLEHSLFARDPVTKCIYLGPMYRRERPAKGRYRQFYQAGAEVLGDSTPFCDAELISLLVRFLEALSISDIEVLINSVGSPETRSEYRRELLRYLEPHQQALSSDSQQRLSSNPLRILDSKDPNDQAIVQDAPKLLDYLAPADQDHLERVVQLIASTGIDATVNPRLVRGLDYYTGTLFEVVSRSADLGAQNALGGGGRYDGLVEMLGGEPTAAAGFAIGIERVLLAMNCTPSQGSRLDVCVMSADRGLRDAAFSLVHTLRAHGFHVGVDWRGLSIKSQMRRADKVGAKFAVILGEREAKTRSVQLKDLGKHTQFEVPIEGLPARLHDLMKEIE